MGVVCKFLYYFHLGQRLCLLHGVASVLKRLEFCTVSCTVVKSYCAEQRPMDKDNQEAVLDGPGLLPVALE